MKCVIGIAGGLAVATAGFVLSALPAFGDNVGTVNAQVKVASGNAARAYNVTLHGPCGGSNGAGETMTMQIVYTAGF